VTSMLRRYGAFAAMAAQELLAYQIWVWLRLIVGLIALVVFSAFWRAVYAGSASVAGIPFSSMLTYALLAQCLAGAGESDMLTRFAFDLRDGRIVHELSRPVDPQLSRFTGCVATWVLVLATRLPLVAAAVSFGAELPRDAAAWLAFLASFFAGATVMFCFEWIFGCLAFYTTEAWGLRTAYVGLAAFFGGTLVPLDLMPAGLRFVATLLPFRQIVYVPVSFLAGLTPPAEAPRVLAGQLAWALGLLVVSRLVFARAVRVVTVQGG
jgi:ABC-2 type transport system permease protein